MLTNMNTLYHIYIQVTEIGIKEFLYVYLAIR